VAPGAFANRDIGEASLGRVLANVALFDDVGAPRAKLEAGAVHIVRHRTLPITRGGRGAGLSEPAAVIASLSEAARPPEPSSL
jgi:hypothetical protein